MKKILLLFFLFCSPLALAESLVKTISVKGEGEIKVKPDRATIMLTVRTKAKDAKTAQAKNAREMARVDKLLKTSFGLEARNIQTSSFQLQPEHRYHPNGKQEFLGYMVDHSLSITLRQLDRLGSLLDNLVSDGKDDVAVLLQQVQFGSDKQKEQEIQAMELAMQNAEARARALARFAKRDIKGVLRISDSSVNFQPPPFHRMMGGAEMEATKMTADTQVSTGEITVQSNVAVEYLMD